MPPFLIGLALKVAGIGGGGLFIKPLLIGAAVLTGVMSCAGATILGGRDSGGDVQEAYQYRAVIDGRVEDVYTATTRSPQEAAAELHAVIEAQMLAAEAEPLDEYCAAGAKWPPR